MNVEITERLDKFREKMKDAGIAAAVIPQNDPHQSEYIAEHWQVRRFFSGFTGSAGTLVITSCKALLWTDSRYFLQAASQLEGTGIELMKDGLETTPSINEWLGKNLEPGSKVGVNGWLVSVDAGAAMEKSLADAGLLLVTSFDPVDELWPQRPALPADPAFIHDIKYAGESASLKLVRIREALASALVTSFFVSALDEIAWILNLRGTDVHCNPVATCFLYISAHNTVLFIDSAKLTPEVERELSATDVYVQPYVNVLDFLSKLPDSERVLIDPARTGCVVGRALGNRMVEGTSPVAMMKAVKNQVQIEGFRNAMRKDGAALVEAFMEIERRLLSGEPTTEMDVADILQFHRSRQPLFFDISFDTIAGYGPNGAIVHYSATAETNTTLKTQGLLLVDSGAQYLDGTTDITRTIALGTPTPEEKRDFTLVLKGMIALAMAVFPVGTRGVQLDILAHQYLWRAGQNYMHGTGHGIGHFLNVHEGPQTIRNNNNMTPITAGMVTSDEPGLYKTGVHGIRCENCLLAVPAEIQGADSFSYLRFETLTLFPFDLSLIDKDLLNHDEIEWLDSYHLKVRNLLSPLLNEKARKWLEIKTQPIKS